MDIVEVLDVVAKSNVTAYCASNNRFKLLLALRREVMLRQVAEKPETYWHVMYGKSRTAIDNLLATVRAERNFFGFTLSGHIAELLMRLEGREYTVPDSLIDVDFYEPISFKTQVDGVADTPDSFAKVGYDFSALSIDDIDRLADKALGVTVLAVYRYIAIAKLALANDDGSADYKTITDMANGSISYFETAKGCFEKLYGYNALFAGVDYDAAECATPLYAVKYSELADVQKEQVTTIAEAVSNEN